MIEVNDSAKGAVLKEEEASDTETGVALGGVGGADVGAIAGADMAIKVGKKVRSASREVAKKTSEVKEAISDKIEEVRDGIHEAKPKDRHVREL